jgi:uncharacterized DUF497 family protein
MVIMWDELKRRSNLAKHGLDFASLEAGFDFEAARVTRSEDGRLKAVGTLNNVPVVVIFATLGTEAISIVSLRPASRKERTIR